MAFGDKVKAQAQKAASRGPNPADRIEGGMKLVGPARFAGTVSASKGPVSGGDGPNCFYILQKPLSQEKGQAAKET